MFESFFKELKIQLYDRLGSPLLVSFVISWSLVNYRFLVILFSEAGVSTSFQLIQKYSFPYWHSYCLEGFLYPLCGALIYIYAYPWPARKTYEFMMKRRQELIEVKQKAEGLQLITEERSQRLRSEMRELAAKHLGDIRARDEEIDGYKTQLAELLKKLSGIENAPAPKQPIDAVIHSKSPDLEVNSDMQDILEIIGKDGYALTENIGAGLSMDNFEVEHCVDKLAELGFAQRSKGNSRNISLTVDGRAYLYGMRQKVIEEKKK